MSGREAGLRWAVPLLLVAALALAVWWVAGGGAAVPDVVTPVRPGVSTADGAPPHGTRAGPERAPVPRGGGSPTASPTNHYVVVSAGSGDPIEGATLRLVSGGRVVGTTDADGAVSVSGYGVSDLVFSAEGHLATFFSLGQRPPEEETEGGGRRYRVALEPDRYSIPFALRFVARDGGEPERVRFRLASLEESPSFSVAVPRERIGADAPVDAALQQAWREHVLVSGRRGFEALPYHCGGLGNLRTYEGPAEITMRFAASGPYRLEAVSSEGEVAQRTVRVTLGRSAPLIIELTPGYTMKGVVSSVLGGAVRGASVRMVSPWVGVGEAVTGEVGAFELGPVPDEPFELEVRHHDFETVRTPPRRPTAPPQAVVLRPRARWEVRGQVRVRPSKKPVAGAEVAISWVDIDHEVRVVTGDDGWFSRVITADEAEIVIRAEGFSEYAERVVRPTAPVTYDLLPATADARVSAGLTALLEGEVRGPDGEPRPGTGVLVVPQAHSGWSGTPGRHISRGGVLSLPHTATADEQGRFRLECRVGGPARLVALDGVSVAAQDALPVEVTLGRITRDLVVRTRR